jgi:phthalate 4,5-cis-dihydrodiol dehydrogenase
MIVSFDQGDVRLTAAGLRVYGDETIREIPLGEKGKDGRNARLDTYYEALVHDRPLPADGRWGMATLEVLLAVEESGRKRAEVFLSHQTPTVD